MQYTIIYHNNDIHVEYRDVFIDCKCSLKQIIEFAEARVRVGETVYIYALHGSWENLVAQGMKGSICRL